MNFSRRNTTLQDTLQEVPQLLEACAAISDWTDGSYALGYRSGVRNLRLVCKHTSQTALLAVRSYHLTISAQPSQIEPVWKVAGLLKTAHMKHLHLDIMAPSGNDMRPHEAGLGPHISQLLMFLATMGSMLKSVTSMEVTMRFASSRTVTQGPHRAANNPPNGHSHIIHTREDAASGGVSLAALEHIASLLAGACPDVLRFGVSGSLGEFAVRKFVSCWPKLTKLEIIEQVLSANVLSALFKQLPCLTLFKMKRGVPIGTEAAYIEKLIPCAALTHLFVGWSVFGVEGFSLPAGLMQVTCTNLPAKICVGLQLPILEQLHLTDTAFVCLEIEVLASLLRVAPKLQELCGSQHGLHSVYVGPCTAGEFSDMQYLYQRMTATGFTLSGFTVKCGYSKDRVYSVGGNPEGNGEAEDVLMLMVRAPGVDVPLLPLHRILAITGPFLGFTTCTLSAHCNDEMEGCMLMALKLFPDITELKLAGPWQDVNLSASGNYDKIEKVCFMEDSLVTSLALQLVLSFMPSLMQLTLTHPAVTADKVFDGELQSTEAKNKEVQFPKAGIDDARMKMGYPLPLGWDCKTSLRSFMQDRMSSHTIWFKKPGMKL